MSRAPSLAGDPRVVWSFLVNIYSTGWWWYPRGVGFLYCMPGLLQFEAAGTMPFRSPAPWQHTHRRVLLLSPWAIPNHFTVVVFEGGEVSVSIARNREKIRTVLAECGFDVVDAPPQRMYPFNQRKAWEQHMGPWDPSSTGEPAVTGGPTGPRVLAQELPQGTVLGGVDKPMSIDVPCQACGAQVELEYHDIQARWYAAAGSTAEASSTSQAFDTARPLAEDETALDMTCPQCAQPMRVIVAADEWRMSIWAYYVTGVLVLVP